MGVVSVVIDRRVVSIERTCWDIVAKCWMRYMLNMITMMTTFNYNLLSEDSISILLTFMRFALSKCP